ncbi:MAG: ParB N-terminal domain-containing protein [Alphaproteobacteria bacterium]|nr:ParB N-terminal domain-containing protein [Alphaproteobacteria bacterium]
MSKASAFGHLGHNLKIKNINCSDLKPYKNNPRTHSKKKVEQLASSMKEFGWTNPILIDNDRNIIAGHGRLEAAKLIGLEKVPTIELGHLSQAQKKAYIIADNKLAENAGWDIELLEIEIQGITELDVDYDLTLTGFETGEIDLLLYTEEEDLEEAKIPEPPKKPISKLGDLWHLGHHRLLCADATKKKSYTVLMGDHKAQMVFTDPPYNVPINGHVCGKGKKKHDEFQMASGEMSEAQFSAFLTTITKHLRASSYLGSLHYICMDWRHMRELLDAGQNYTELKNLCVWNKTNGGMGSLYRSKHELVFVFKHGIKAHINNVELGKNGRYRTNVWDYAGVNTFQNTKDLEMHPTVKPIAMIKDAIMDCTKRNNIVLDVFGGSGSTLIAAEECKRKAYLMEIDPGYVDVILQRYWDHTGIEPVHENGSTLSEMREVRNV